MAIPERAPATRHSHYHAVMGITRSGFERTSLTSLSALLSFTNWREICGRCWSPSDSPSDCPFGMDRVHRKSGNEEPNSASRSVDIRCRVSSGSSVASMLVNG